MLIFFCALSLVEVGCILGLCSPCLGYNMTSGVRWWRWMRQGALRGIKGNCHLITARPECRGKSVPTCWQLPWGSCTRPTPARAELAPASSFSREKDHSMVATRGKHHCPHRGTGSSQNQWAILSTGRHLEFGPQNASLKETAQYKSQEMWPLLPETCLARLPWESYITSQSTY